MKRLPLGVLIAAALAVIFWTVVARTGTEPAGATSHGVAQISAGKLTHTCALTLVGGAKCWGNNALGQLGNGTTTNSSSPVDVTGLTSGGASVVAGGSHSCALTTGGGVKCWGQGLFGQLGNGSTTNSSTAVDVTGLASGVAAVASGESHACALTTGGGVKCWGYNFYGQLGNGSTTNSSTAVDVTGLTSGVAAIAAGKYVTCALTTDGGMKCWGENGFGQLGNGTTTNSNTPVDVTGLTSGVAVIAPGANHSCAVTTGGGAKCWGINHLGQLGVGTTTGPSCSGICYTTPVDVSGLTSGVASISPGNGNYACALTTGGGVKCWGNNVNGQLGNGTATSSTTPVDVTGLTSGVGAVSAGQNHTCAITTGFGAKCWGNNGVGQLGNAATGGPSCSGVCHPTAVDVSGLTGPKPTPTPTETPTDTPTATPCADLDGDTICDGDDPDADGDGCLNTDEQQTAIGSEEDGGLRDYLNPHDYFNPTGDGENRIDDVLATVLAYFDDDGDGNPGLPPYAAGYNPLSDRSNLAASPNAWNTGAPDGLQRVQDIVHAVNSYFHDCA